MRLRHIDSMYILALYTVNYILEYTIIYHALPIIGLSITHPRAIGMTISRRVAVLTSRRSFMSILVIGEYPIPNNHIITN
jgi:glucose uptake protein GlcU